MVCNLNFLLWPGRCSIICFQPASLISPFQPLAFLLFLHNYPFPASVPLRLLFSLSNTLSTNSLYENLFVILQESVHMSPSQGGLPGLSYLKEAATLITLTRFVFVSFYCLFPTGHFSEYGCMLVYLFMYFFFLLSPNTIPSLHPTSEEPVYNVCYSTQYFREISKYPPSKALPILPALYFFVYFILFHLPNNPMGVELLYRFYQSRNGLREG